MPAQTWLGRVLQPLRARQAPPGKPERRGARPCAGRDFQRSRVYRWEQEHVFPHDREPLSIDACAALVEAAYRWWHGPLSLRPGWAPPNVTDGRGRRHACGSREVIKLPRWARTRPVVLHECAHGLAPDRHGPEFVKVYVSLLVRFMGLDRASLLASLAASGVKVAGAVAGEVRASRRLAARRRSG
jgi:hypothetical protein